MMAVEQPERRRRMPRGYGLLYRRLPKVSWKELLPCLLQHSTHLCCNFGDCNQSGRSDSNFPSLIISPLGILNTASSCARSFVAKIGWPDSPIVIAGALTVGVLKLSALKVGALKIGARDRSPLALHVEATGVVRHRLKSPG